MSTLYLSFDQVTSTRCLRRCPVCKYKDTYFDHEYLMVQHFYAEHDPTCVAISLAEMLFKNE
jgi:hypothetical protein